jgi:hypothetical protein
MSVFTANPTFLAFVRQKDWSPAVQAGWPLVKRLTITAESAITGITITKVGGATWLTVPSTCISAAGFDVEINTNYILPRAGLAQPWDRSETLQFAYAGYTTLSLVVTFKDLMGFPPR